MSQAESVGTVLSHKLRLGVIGLGALGSRIATRLLRTGFSLEIYDIATARESAPPP